MAERQDISAELSLAEARLAELDGERTRLLARIAKLRAEAVPRREAPVAVSPPSVPLRAVPGTAAEKVALFGSLFRGRSDVYPRRWENTRTGKSGYSRTARTTGRRAFVESRR